MAVKQVIVLRTDIEMKPGKMCSQAAHASMKVLLDRGVIGFRSDICGYDGSTEATCLYKTAPSTLTPGVPPVFTFPLTPAMKTWLSGAFVKIVVGIDSEAGLLTLEEKARSLGIPCAIIKDNGKTTFHDVPTYTALAVGPEESELVDQVTGGLKLL
jgi:PTH2 family peptidyl-tRNA hydrolase